MTAGFERWRLNAPINFSKGTSDNVIEQMHTIWLRVTAWKLMYWAEPFLTYGYLPFALYRGAGKMIIHRKEWYCRCCHKKSTMAMTWSKQRRKRLWNLVSPNTKANMDVNQKQAHPQPWPIGTTKGVILESMCGIWGLGFPNCPNVAEGSDMNYQQL